MQLAISAAKPRLSELVACHQRKRGGIDFERLEATCKRLGIEQDPPEVAKEMIAAFHDPALSREVLGLDDDY